MLRFLVFLPVLACMLAVSAAWAQEVPMLEAGEKKHSNMDSRLADMYEKAAAKDGLDRPQAATTADPDGERVQVVLEMVSTDAPIPQNLGIIVEVKYEILVQANVPVRNLEAVASDKNVVAVRMPNHPVTSIAALPIPEDSPSDGVEMAYIIPALAIPAIAAVFVWNKVSRK